MSEFPSAEAILLEVQQSFGIKSRQTVEKERFAKLERRLSDHLAMLSEIVEQIFNILEIRNNDDLERDLLISASQMLDFHTNIQNMTRTYCASDKQIIWSMLAYQWIPGLARKLGFWSIAQPLAQDISRGNLWFIPHKINLDDETVRLPIQTAVDWWLDLLGCQLDQIWEHDENQENKIRNLQYWKSGKTPDLATIGKMLPQNKSFIYKGAFERNKSNTINEQFRDSIDFIQKNKKIKSQYLSDELPFVSPQIVEAVLSGNANEQEAESFVIAVAHRWKAPSNEVVRRRFMIARLIQDAHFRLSKFIAPDVDPRLANSSINRVLQIWQLFQETYKLTLDAEKGCSSIDESNRRFADIVPGWLAQSYLYSIMNVESGVASDFASFMSDKFCDIEPTSDVYDLFEGGQYSNGPVQRPVSTLQTDRRELEALLEKLKQAIEDGRKSDAEALLHKARSSSITNEFEPDILFLEGRHRLNSNDVEQAKSLLTNAFEKSRNGGFGLTRANTAYACLGLEMAFASFSEKAERYFRVIATYPVHVPPGLQPTTIDASNSSMLDMLFRNVSVAASEDFWTKFYRPYPDVEPLERPMMPVFNKLVGGFVDLAATKNTDDLERWIRSNRKDLERRLVDVRGDTFFNVMLKMKNSFERQAPPFADIVEQMRFALQVLAKKLPLKAIDTPDFKRQTPLILSSAQADAELVSILLEKGANFDAQTIEGRTALHAAAASRSTECFTLLLSKGADPTIETVDGSSALHTAVKFGLLEAVQITLEKWNSRFSREELLEMQQAARDIHANYKKFRPKFAEHGRNLGPKRAYELIIELLKNAAITKKET
jgi:hypothetical protein